MNPQSIQFAMDSKFHSQSQGQFINDVISLDSPVQPRPLTAKAQKKLDMRQHYRIIDRKVLKNAPEDFNNLEFVPNKDVLIHSIPSHICVSNFLERKIEKFRIHCRQGCERMKVMPGDNLLIYTNYNDFTMRLMDFEAKQKFLKFEGHNARINMISTEGTGNTPFFMTSSDDNYIKFWDGREKYSTGYIQYPAIPHATLHPNGSMFAVGSFSCCLFIHDRRVVGRMIHQFKIEPTPSVLWRQVKYSKDGKHILVTTNSNLIHLFDGETAVWKRTFRVKNTTGLEYAADFSRCGKFLLCGSSDAKIYVFDVATGENTCIYSLKPATNVKFMSLSSATPMFATAGDGILNFWSEPAQQ